MPLVIFFTNPNPTKFLGIFDQAQAATGVYAVFRLFLHAAELLSLIEFLVLGLVDFLFF
jgi:hypothetical protein